MAYISADTLGNQSRSAFGHLTGSELPGDSFHSGERNLFPETTFFFFLPKLFDLLAKAAYVQDP